VTSTIHPTAIVHASAVVDHDAIVGPYCVIGPECRIGRGAVLQSHVTVESHTTIGRDVVVFPFAVLGGEPQDLKYKGGPTRLIIGDRTRIREHATVHRGTELGGGKTVVGSDCLIMVGVHVAHDCEIQDEVVIANGTMLGGHCRVEKGVGIGGGAGIHHFTTIGTLAFVAGMSRITRDVPPYTVVEGAPAEPRKINTTALARRKWPTEEIEALREAFRLIYLREHGGTVQATLDELRARSNRHASVVHLCDFLERVHFGVHGRSMERDREDRVLRA
jgi:UDP-N-acetylglucosamine acyltransferase